MDISFILTFIAMFMALGYSEGSSSKRKLIYKNRLIDINSNKNNSFPYLIRMQTESDTKTICTGALVVLDGKQVVLTSATCVLSFVDWNKYTRTPKRSINLVAGGTCNGESQQVRRVVTWGYHSELDYLKYENDIAVIHFDQPFDLNEDVQPVALPTRARDTNGILIVPRWERGQSAPTEMHLKVISDDECAATPGSYGAANHLCALRSTGASGYYCYGPEDQGAPAVTLSRGRNKKYLAGIAVFNPLRRKADGSQTCIEAEFGVPNVFSEVCNHVNWIRETVKGWNFST